MRLSVRLLPVILAVALLFASAARAAAAELSVHFFDVGQGDSALVVSPTGKTVLIDAGPPEAAASLEARVRALMPAGSGPIDLMVMTHPHADHLGGFRRLVEALGARTFLEPGTDHASPLYLALLDALERRHVALKVGEAGRIIDLGGGASLKLLAPSRPPIKGSRSDVNANSIVMRLTFGTTAVYFAADSEHETERRILASAEEVRADVYKVAHHASRYSNSPELMARIAPRFAVVSVGTPNEYGHPHQEVLDRLARRGARVFRTDLDGEVVVRSDGEHLEVQALGATPQPAAAHAAKSAAAAPPHPERMGAASAAPRAAAIGAASYVASRSSQVFHRADCPGAATIKARNRIAFASRAEAVAAGRRPARDCDP